MARLSRSRDAYIFICDSLQMEGPIQWSTWDDTAGCLKNLLVVSMHPGISSSQVRWITTQSIPYIRPARCVATGHTWLDTPTRFCSQNQSSPLPTFDVANRRADPEPVANRAAHGTPRLLVRAKSSGACDVTAREYKMRVPANNA